MIEEEYLEIHNQKHAVSQTRKAMKVSSYSIYFKWLIIFVGLFFIMKYLFQLMEKLFPGKLIVLLVLIYLCLFMSYLYRTKKFNVKDGMEIIVRLDDDAIHFLTQFQSMTISWQRIDYFVELEDELVGFTQRKLLIFREVFGIPKDKLSDYEKLKNYLSSELGKKLLMIKLTVLTGIC